MKQWVLDLEDGSLSSGQSLSNLTPKAAEVLNFLIANAGTVMSRDEILREVWRDLHVSPDLVREYVFEIRKALEDSATKPNYIETVGRRGFRLIGPVSTQTKSKTLPASDGAKTNTNSRTIQMPAIKYCQSKDGTSIAHAGSGQGLPLLFAGS